MINIGLTFNDKFAVPAQVLIASILLNSVGDDQFKFFIFGDELSRKTLDGVEKLKDIKQFELQHIKVDKSEFQNFFLPEKGHFRTVNYFRIKIPSLIPEIDKILYIDCDTIVKTSLSPLFKLDISNYFLAATRAATSNQNNRRLGLPKFAPYFLSGLMLINCRKWRENGIESKLVEYIKTSPIDKLLNLEQDAINYVLGNGILQLPSNWNVEIRTDITYPRYYHKYLINPFILHYNSGDKPWHEETKQDTKEFNFYLNKINSLNEPNNKEYSNNMGLQSHQFSGNRMNNEKCVYTVLIGDYEKLNEQDVAEDSEIDFICFTDIKDLTSKSWRIVNIDPVFPLDNVRSSREVKISAHRYLPQFRTSLYIDNSVTLKKKPEEIFNDFLRDEFDLYCVRHSYRETVLDEFEEVFRLNFDQQNKILEQLNTYSLIDPELFDQKPYWTGFIIRNHNEKQIIDLMRDWLAQVMRYSRRDQLSLNYVIRKHNIKVRELIFDNYASEYHLWPTAVRFGSPLAPKSLQAIIENNLRVDILENKLENITQNFDELEVEMKNLKDANHILKTKMNTKNAKIHTFTNRINEQKQIIKSSTEKFQNLKGLYNAQQSKLQLLQSNNDAQKKIIHTLRSENEAKKSSIQTMHSEIEAQQQNIQNLEKIINNLQQEILFYADSRSWRITRPLRKLMKYLKLN